MLGTHLLGWAIFEHPHVKYCLSNKNCVQNEEKKSKIEIKYLRVGTSTIGYLLSFLYLAFYSIAQNTPWGWNCF